jgi:MFS family permease
MVVSNTDAKTMAAIFVVLLGLVSLFADMTYEGARSITGPYLAFLGASATVTGIVAGLGEFIGYGLRLVSGHLTDRTGRYWAITLLGYSLNLFAVPLLAIAGNWEFAAFLMVMERLGKAVRTPARDAMLSYAASKTGRGWGFGLHEAMDQIGAVLGPLLVAAILYSNGGFSWSFGVLIVPAILALSLLVVVRQLYPRPKELETTKPQKKIDGELPRVFWFYLVFVAVSVSGYAHFQLISYHFSLSTLFSDAQIPVFFAVAMGVDALVALIVGPLFDRAGLRVLLAVPILSIPITPLAFSTNHVMALSGVIFWGAVMGIQESIMRAAIADLTPVSKRGSAYGIFNVVYGLSWLLGSTVMGLLYGIGVAYIISFSVVLESCAILLLAFL